MTAARVPITIVVANSYDQAAAQLSHLRAETIGARVIGTDRLDGIGRLTGALPLAREVLLTEGWEMGRHASDVERLLRRCLAKRAERFEDCRRTSDHVATTAISNPVSLQPDAAR